jgi:NarL family two-component system sensor histidine kinase YdfH
MDLDQPVSDTSRETAVRTVSEALTNITRHAQANRTFVNVKSNDQSLEISIRDDGKGFDPADIQPGHYGLMGIKERVRLIGGKYEIKSSPEKGTILSVKIPLIV